MAFPIHLMMAKVMGMHIDSPPLPLMGMMVVVVEPLPLTRVGCTVGVVEVSVTIHHPTYTTMSCGISTVYSLSSLKNPSMATP